MIQGIITIAVSVLSATGILGIGTRSILNRMQTKSTGIWRASPAP